MIILNTERMGSCMVKAQKAVGKSGWSAEETQMLMGEAKIAYETGMPLKRAFDAIAELTGRKPNSIRNYYYLRIKEDEGYHSNVFVPFSKEQVSALMRRMLCEQAQGKSVRKIAFEMAQGDKKEMLRYQNKYRSVLKNSEKLVREIMNELSDAGVGFVNPYESSRGYKKRDISTIISELAANLSLLGVDAEQLLSNLLDISKGACSKTYVKSADSSKLKELCKLNREFVSMSGMERISALNDYVSDLSGLLQLV